MWRRRSRPSGAVAPSSPPGSNGSLSRVVVEGRMEFRILGPLEVLDGDVRLPLGKPREKAVLAALLVHANEPLSRERLVDLVWGGTPPKTAGAALYNAVS